MRAARSKPNSSAKARAATTASSRGGKAAAQPDPLGGTVPGRAIPAEPGRAKLFQNGRSQAVRLPKEFRFAGREVEIRRQGMSVVLTPVIDAAARNLYWKELWKTLDAMQAELGDFPECEDDTVTEPEEIFPEGW